MNNKRPITFREISSVSSPPPTPRAAVERLAASIEQTKGDLLEDQKFLKNLISRCVESPDSFARERKGEVSGAEKKIERHSLKGRTNKTKLIIYLSEEETKQLASLVNHRGDRGPSDLVNQLICTALATLRMI
tara:strand:+ start:150 stop:548 length:399 start_codon:yes stop_codon:yes gene_type:complete